MRFIKNSKQQYCYRLSTVTRWFNKLRHGVKDLNVQHLLGRPITGTVIENDIWCSYDEIEAETSFSSDNHSFTFEETKRTG